MKTPPTAYAIVLALGALLALSGLSCDKPTVKPAKPAPPATQPTTRAAVTPAVPLWPAETDKGDSLLFDGKTLAHWKALDKIYFDRPGKVSVQDGALVLAEGKELTGVLWTGPKIPREGYEITLKAQRAAGGDFFLGLTFPIGKGHASLILGGWGGQLVGMSSIDGFDASENATTGVFEFKNGTWYDVKLRVTKLEVEAFLNGKELFSIDRDEHKFDVRAEMETACPLGLASFATKGAYKDLRIRKLAE